MNSRDVYGLVVSWECQVEMDFKIYESMVSILGEPTLTNEQRTAYFDNIRIRKEEYLKDPERAFAVLKCPLWALAVFGETE